MSLKLCRRQVKRKIIHTYSFTGKKKACTRSMPSGEKQLPRRFFKGRAKRGGMLRLNRPINRDIAYIFIICATVISVFRPLLSCFFMLDEFDYLAYLSGQGHQVSFANFWRFTSQMCMSTWMFRPLVGLQYLQYHIFGFNARGYFTVLLIQTLLLCIIIYYAAKRITNNTAVSFFNALLYGIHPLQFDSLSMAFNTQTLSIIFVCLAFLCLCRFVHTARRINLYCSCSLCLLALMGWQEALGVPFALIVYLLLFGRDIPRNKKYEAIGSLLFIFFLTASCCILSKR